MANKKCPVAKKCSGCQLSNMTYEQQLEWKQKDTEKLLGGFGKVSKIIGADSRITTETRCRRYSALTETAG